MSGFIKKNKWKFCFLIIYTVFLIFGVINHEPSVDEVQAWNIARDLSIMDIFKQMQIEGHPCLWHLILCPFAKLGFPVYFISIISSLIMIITAYLILFKSPFNFIVKLIILLSSPFLYQYSIIARSYSLIALFIILLCISYKDRMKHPYRYGILLFCLFNSHVIMGGMASILLFLFMLESVYKMVLQKKLNKHLIFGCSIGLLGGIVLCVQLLGSYDSNCLTTHLDYSTFDLKGFLSYFFEKYNLDFYYITNSMFSMNFSYVIFFFLIVILLITFYLNYKVGITVLISYLYFVFVNYFLFYSITLRALLIIFLLLFASWIIIDDMHIQNQNKIIFRLNCYLLQLYFLFYCIISIPFGLKSYIDDINYRITDGPEIANYIEKHVDRNATIMEACLSEATILGYLPGRSFYNIATGKYMTFITWDKNQFDEVSYEEILVSFDYIKGKKYIIFPEYEHSYLNNIIENLQRENYIQLVYKSKGEAKYYNTNQRYIIYGLYEVLV